MNGHIHHRWSEGAVAPACVSKYLRFNVSVQDFSVMDMFQGQADLNEPVQDLSRGGDGATKVMSNQNTAVHKNRE